MKWIKSLLIVFALVAGTAAFASAQEGYGGWQDRSWQRDHDRDRDRASQWQYQQDRDRDRWERKHRRDRDNDRDADDGYYGNNRGVYDRNPYYRQNIQQARENGYQWGVRDGKVDRQAGRSYRATSNETYRRASMGYVSAYGDKSQYQAEFRQAYEQGYQRGYGSGPYRGQSGWTPWGRR